MDIPEFEAQAEGVTPAPGGVALLLIDFINSMDFPGAEDMGAAALEAAGVALTLREEADRLGVPVIYVNDNYGQWLAERSAILDQHRKGNDLARRLVERVAPRPSDYFVIKPQVSGFYATHLPVLLPKLGVRRLVLTGIAADICVLFTAADAHMRAYELWVPKDAVVAEAAQHRDWALQIMAKSLGAETRPTRELGLEAWLGARA